MGKKEEEFEPIEFKIVVPTFRRAGEVTSLDVVDHCILCPTESEKDQYREHRNVSMTLRQR